MRQRHAPAYRPARARARRHHASVAGEVAIQTHVETVLKRFVDATVATFGQDLVSVVLFGSGAEDRLRPASDVNVVAVLRRFDPERVGSLAEPLHVASVAVGLQCLFLTEEDLPAAVEAFPVKFADIRRRHRVLHGTDPFAALDIPRAAAVLRVRQVLLNLELRARAQYIEQHGQPEGLTRLLSSATGPLRAAAAELLELEGQAVSDGRSALDQAAGEPTTVLTKARTGDALPDAPGAARWLLALLHRLRLRAAALPP